MERATTPDGATLYVSTADGARGSKGPFYVAYADPEGDRRYGWYCGNCESADAAMDPMGRVECNDCGNRRKPTEWDAAHE